MTEAQLTKFVQLAIGQPPISGVSFRNTVGFDEIRKIHYGLVKGSSDLIGWIPLKITEQDVGRTVAVFAGWEIKGPKTRVRPEQTVFRDQVLASGGYAVIIRSVEEMVTEFNDWR
jgi:hypothetical protein